ncbi:MAG: hypothetical protein R2795_24545 [Saprospiraceae bacterium]
MAKKRFKEGFDSLFGAEEAQAAPSLFPDADTDGSAQRDDERKNSKGFASQLDAFLAEAFESAAQQERDANTSASGGTKRLTGLDLLIQRTAENPSGGKHISDKRRLTLAFDKAQLARLKEIAEREGIYLKDLINQLIERYLQERS